MTKINLELVTPEGTLVSQEVDHLTGITETGEIGIYKDHAALKSKLQIGTLKYFDENNAAHYIAVMNGIIEVSKNKVSIISDYAIRAENIDEARAQKKADDLKAELQISNENAKTANPNLLLAEARLQKHLLLLKTARLQRD
jgi:F-type H+-transporting ATPase subunit epsilon